jgi:hypothetical protein
MLELWQLKNGAPVAQLDRAFGYEPKGREFDSLRARHSSNFRSSKDQVERLLIRRIDIYSVPSAGRKHHSEQSGFFRDRLTNVKKMRLIREFENPDGINDSVRVRSRKSPESRAILAVPRQSILLICASRIPRRGSVETVLSFASIMSTIRCQQTHHYSRSRATSPTAILIVLDIK